jgi:hypothetical protein
MESTDRFRPGCESTLFAGAIEQLAGGAAEFV